MTNTKTSTKTRTETASAVDTVSKTSLITMSVASALVGLWAVSCLIGAFVSAGPAEVIKGFFSATIGM